MPQGQLDQALEHLPARNLGQFAILALTPIAAAGMGLPLGQAAPKIIRCPALEPRVR